jgi:hypothetical protein
MTERWAMREIFWRLAKSPVPGALRQARPREQPAQLVHGQIAPAHHQHHILSSQPQFELEAGSE